MAGAQRPCSTCPVSLAVRRSASCWQAHRRSLAPHSFPTRRSSDLRIVAMGTPDDIRARTMGHARVEIRCDTPRSEEHTSELQSPMYLVCRLLLEKKNESTTGLMSRACSHSPYGAQPISPSDRSSRG